MRLIDADALLKVLKHRVKGNEESGIVLGTNSALEIMEEWVRSIPAVDAVEVVRCEDCMFRVLDTVNGEDWCNHTLGLCSEVYATDYCCHGERKNDV